MRVDASCVGATRVFNHPLRLPQGPTLEKGATVRQERVLLQGNASDFPRGTGHGHATNRNKRLRHRKDREEAEFTRNARKKQILCVVTVYMDSRPDLSPSHPSDVNYQQVPPPPKKVIVLLVRVTVLRFGSVDPAGSHTR